MVDFSSFRQTRHWSILSDNPMLDQGAVGTAPAAYAAIVGFSDPRLENHSLTRQDLIDKCQAPDADPWISFIRIMSWGAQDKMAGGKSKVSAMFDQRSKITEKMIRTKTSTNKSESFQIWSKNPVKHLWIAYFTKVLFFLKYPKENCYIMDKWTASSYNLLMGGCIIKRHHMHMHSSAPEAMSKYEDFCAFVDAVASELSADTGRVVSGMEAEAAIFSFGGRGERQGKWRAHIKQHAAEIGL
jgi:hypothetical protein